MNFACTGLVVLGLVVGCEEEVEAPRVVPDPASETAPETTPDPGPEPEPEREPEREPEPETEPETETETGSAEELAPTFLESHRVEELRMAGGVPYVLLERDEGEEPARPRFVSHEAVDRVWRGGRPRSPADGRTIRVFVRDGRSCDGRLGRPVRLGIEDSEPEQAGLFIDRESSDEGASFRPERPYNEVRWSWYAPVEGCPRDRFELGTIGLSADAPSVVTVSSAPESQVAVSMMMDRLRARRELGRVGDRQPPPLMFREGDVLYVHVLRNIEGNPRVDDDYGETVWLDVRFGVGDEPQCLRFRRCREEEIGSDYSRLPDCRHWGRCSPAPLAREGNDCGAAPEVGYADLDGDGTPEYVADYWMGLCDTGAVPFPGWLHERDRPAREMRWVGLP